MSAEKARHPGESQAGTVVVFLLAAGWLGFSLTVWGAARLAGLAPRHPLTVVLDLARGALVWTPAATGWAGVLVAGWITLAVASFRVWWRWRRRGDRSRVDHVTAHLARGKDLAPLQLPAVRAEARRLGHDPAAPGICLGVPVTPRGAATARRLRAKPQVMLYSPWEWLSVDVWGPRRGKTTSRVIPAIVEAPGAVFVTSNRRDVVEATRGVREHRDGTPRRVWVFDPQRIVGEPATWYWDPLTTITGAERDLWDVRAEKLADLFWAGSQPAGATPDAFFDPEGKDLVATLLLAAAVGGYPITQVYSWVVDPVEEPVRILHGAGWGQVAVSLQQFMAYSDRQRDGLFGTAKKITNLLRRRAVADWVTPRPGRTAFDPKAFLANQETVYALSKEGVESCGALATALTWACMDTAERVGERSPGGRLPVPLVAPLDELANVIRWPELPSLYSHYGGRGIIVLGILQNWSQGVRCFGEHGMKQLWDAATIRYYGGGVADEAFLRHLSTLVGQHWAPVTSTSTSRSVHGSSTSTNRQLQRETTLTEADLEHLPRGRAIILWGARPVMVRPVPWYERPYAAAVQASRARYDPGHPSPDPTATLRPHEALPTGTEYDPAP